VPFKCPIKRKEYELKRSLQRKVLRKVCVNYAEKVRQLEMASKRKAGHKPLADYKKEIKDRSNVKKILKKTKGTLEYARVWEVRRKHWERNKERINEYQRHRYYKTRPDRAIISAVKRVESGNMSLDEFDKFVSDVLARPNQNIKK
jgi:hypothetical protein